MREGGSGSGGREGRLRKGTSEEGMDGRRKEGKEEASGGRGERGRGEKEERGRKGDRGEGNVKGGTLRRTLASIHYTAVSAQNNTQRGPCHCDFGIMGIVMRRNVLFDRWMT